MPSRSQAHADVGRGRSAWAAYAGETEIADRDDPYRARRTGFGYLSGNLDDPRVTSSFIGIEAGYAAITPVQVQAAVVKYLRPGGSYELRVLPET